MDDLHTQRLYGPRGQHATRDRWGGGAGRLPGEDASGRTWEPEWERGPDRHMPMGAGIVHTFVGTIPFGVDDWVFRLLC